MFVSVELFVHDIADVMLNQSGHIYEYVMGAWYSSIRCCGRAFTVSGRWFIRRVSCAIMRVISQRLLFMLLIDNRQPIFNSTITPGIPIVYIVLAFHVIVYVAHADHGLTLCIVLVNAFIKSVVV